MLETSGGVLAGWVAVVVVPLLMLLRASPERGAYFSCVGGWHVELGGGGGRGEVLRRGERLEAEWYRRRWVWMAADDCGGATLNLLVRRSSDDDDDDDNGIRGTNWKMAGPSMVFIDFLRFLIEVVMLQSETVSLNRFGSTQVCLFRPLPTHWRQNSAERILEPSARTPRKLLLRCLAPGTGRMVQALWRISARDPIPQECLFPLHVVPTIELFTCGRRSLVNIRDFAKIWSHRRARPKLLAVLPPTTGLSNYTRAGPSSQGLGGTVDACLPCTMVFRIRIGR